MDSPTYLFIVVLGGRLNGANIEIHDVIWAIGRTIDETHSQLREQWIGEMKGLHIDSYSKIEYVDGYKIEVIKSESKDQGLSESRSSGLNLWFANLGAYNPSVNYEVHNYELVVANSAKEAKIKAKRKWYTNSEQVHLDDLHKIDHISIKSNLLNNICASNWTVVVSPTNVEINGQRKAHWYGYKRIDK